MLIALSFIIATKCYTEGYFCAINKAYGGGAWSDVQLLIDGNSVKDMETLGIDLAVDSEPPDANLVGAKEGAAATKPRLTIPVGLFDQNDKAYFLLVYKTDPTNKHPGREQHSVILDKAAVKGMTPFLPKAPESPKTDQPSAGQKP